MSMIVTVLGKYSPFPPARGACPGYWVRAASPDIHEVGVLLDCGPGVLARFQEHIGPLSLVRSVILSHLHFDHTADFHVLRYAATPDRRYGTLPPALTVYAPPVPVTEFSLLKYKDAVTARAVEPGETVGLQGLKATFYQGEHGITSYAVRIEGTDGTLAYSGDSRPCQGLTQAAAGADLFLCEASAIEADAQVAAPGHLTARQAGEIAAQAGVKRLVLTHLWPLYDEKQILRECRAVFPGAELAEEGASYRIG